MGILVLASTQIERLEAAIRQEGKHLKDLEIGNFTQEGQRCYGVSFRHGGKKWELSLHINHPNLALINQGKVHLLETVLEDIKKRFRP